MTGRITSAAFVGRQEELERLRRGLRLAAEGSPGTLLIGGEAGVGKTRLVREFAAGVGGEAQVLLGRCLQLRGDSLPYGPIVDALRDLARDLHPAELEELIGPLPELARLLPAGTPPRPRWPAAPVGGYAQSRLFELVLRFLDRLAQRRTVVLIVEDVHWADGSTLDLLSFLVRMLRRERLLLVATYRSDELHARHPLRDRLPELDRSWHLEHLELERFDHEELALLVAGILGHPPSPATVQRIFARSEGNAFLSEELVAVGRGPPDGELPPRLQGILLARVAPLPQDARQVLRVVATVGRPTEHHLLAAAAWLPEARLLAALRETVDRHLLVHQGDAYSFRHVLLQEAVYGELLPGERLRLHAAVARALAEDPQAGTQAQTVAELSHHWYAARDHPRALQAAVAAARAALEAYGLTEAHHQYERALALWGEVTDAARRVGLALSELRVEAAEAARWAGSPLRAAELLQQVLGELGPRLPPARAGLLHARLAECHSEAGDGKAAEAAYEEAMRLVADEPASAEKARVLAGYGTELMRQAQYSASRDVAEQAIVVARAVGARAEEGRALNTLGCDLSLLGDPGTGVAALRRALVLSEAAGDFDDLNRAYYNLAIVLGLDAGQPHEALRVIRRGLERMRELGLELAVPTSLLRDELAVQLWELGRWEEVEALLHEELTRERPAGWALRLQLLAGRLHLAQGRLELASSYAAAAARVLEPLVDPLLETCLQGYLAELAIERMDHPAARSAVARGLQQLAGSEQQHEAIRLCRLGLRAEADAAERAQGRRAGAAVAAEAHATGEQLLATARRLLANVGTGLPESVVQAASCEAEFARLELRSDPQRWAAVAAAWDELSRPYDAAYARWRQAEALLRTRAATPAARVLRQAHQTATELDARPLAHELERLARRARVDLRAPLHRTEGAGATPSSGGPALTPREQEVLQHLMEGRTNRQIARDLFISEKTVSVHVSNLMGKLGAANRAEAAAIARRRHAHRLP